MSSVEMGQQEPQGRSVRIVYSNYRHEISVRTIIPERLWFGSTTWHPQPQWLLDAIDVEKGERRSFAMSDIRAWFLEIGDSHGAGG